MVGVPARLVFAGMVKVMALRDSPFQEFVGEAMDDKDTSSNPYPSIARNGAIAMPFPTAVSAVNGSFRKLFKGRCAKLPFVSAIKRGIDPLEGFHVLAADQNLSSFHSSGVSEGPDWVASAEAVGLNDLAYSLSAKTKKACRFVDRHPFVVHIDSIRQDRFQSPLLRLIH